MRLSVRLCVAVVAALSVVVVDTEQVEPREVHNHQRNFVSPRLSEESLHRLRNGHISSDTRTRQRVRQNIHSISYTQKELDERAVYRASQLLGDRYHSSRGQAETSNPHTVATSRYEPRVPQHIRINHTDFPTIRGSTHNTAPASRTQTTAGDESFSRVHQMGLHTTHERRHDPDGLDSYEPRIPSASKNRLQRLLPQQHAGINNRVLHGDARVDRTSLAAGIGDQVHNALLGASFRPERPPHHRQMAPTTRTRSSLIREPSSTTTSTLSRELDVAEKHLSEAHDVENYLQQQLQDWPDRCCGSRVPFDPRTGMPTGAFQRVAAAGSLKVVHVPVRNSFPPSEVRDLLATPLDPHTLSLTWTAPGGDLDSGTASGYIIRLSEIRHDLQESQFDAAPEETLLETSEALTAAGVYQTAGTRVGVEVPLMTPLQRGHVYYVAFKALDNDGHSSRVSNVARFTVLGSSTANNTAVKDVPSNHARIQTRIEEDPRTTALHGFTSTNGGINTEAPLTAPLPDPASEQQRELSVGGISEQPSLRSVSTASVPEPSESGGSENQRKQKKDRKKKNNKAKRRRKDGRRNGRRRDGRQREGNSDTSVWSSHISDIYAELERWNKS